MTGPEPPTPPPDEPNTGWGLRGPQGCGEWAVVILGVIWVILAIIFVIALVVRLNG